MFLGSNLGATYISIFEFDSKGNIGFGGKSSDTSLVSGVNHPFVGHLNQTGFNYSWIYDFNIPLYNVIAIAFNPDGTKMIAMFNSTNLYMVTFEVKTGVILSKR